MKDQGESKGDVTCCRSESKVNEGPMEINTTNTTVVQTEVWQPQGRPYSVKAWNGQPKKDVNKLTIGCMMAANDRPGCRRRGKDNDLEGDDELICNMTVQSWESLPFLIIIDSGACASVMPTSWCSHVPSNETPQSQAGDYFRAANGNKIYHEGEKVISMMTQEGALRDMKFTVCDVSKALGSVSQMCKTGHRVAFNFSWSNQGSYIEHISTGERLWLQEEGGLYVLKTKVAPAHRQTSKWKAQDFHWQVKSPITRKSERVPTVRPSKEFDEEDLNLLHDEPKETGAEEVDDKQAIDEQWEQVTRKVEELETRVAEQFDDDNGKSRESPPIIKAPVKPTQKEWDDHQTIRTPFAPWCKHCVAARNARRHHPKQGRKGRIVPDIENGEGPTKVSMDYMYLHERVGEHRDIQHNPPYLIVVEHKFGRCWAYQVPNKGINDGAYWVPKRVLQDLENIGIGETRILLKTDQEPSIVCIQTVIQ